MASISCKYFEGVHDVTHIDEEYIQVPEGATVEKLLGILSYRYGPQFDRRLYSSGEISGVPFKTPNMYLNKRRIQWKQDFPAGMKTKVHDGDEVWLGICPGGA